jgi:tetratricopeptide (TPR) repeat protein
MLGFVHLNGQTKKAFIQAAEEAFAQKNYYAALKYFNIVLEFDENDRNALRKSAISAREFNAYDIAAQRYTYLIDSLQDNSDSLDLYHTAIMFRRMGQYDKAIEYFDRYIVEYGSKDEFSEFVRTQKEKTVWASSRFKEVDERVKIKRDSTGINSNFSDFGGAYLNDSLYFSSMRFLEKDSDLNPPRKMSKILKQGSNGIYPVNTEFNEQNKVIANISFNQDKSKVFYTVCDYISESELRCDIYEAVVRKDGTFSDARMLPSMINDAFFYKHSSIYGQRSSFGK